jgi:hypothetical protein
MGWRQYVEKMYARATTREWYRTRGRHAIYANNKPIPLSPEDAPPALTYEGLLAKGAEALANRSRQPRAAADGCGPCLTASEPVVPQPRPGV